MPFASHSCEHGDEPIRKNALPIDPQLLRDVDAIARPYRDAITMLSDIVEENARRLTASGGLTTYQSVLSEEIVSALQDAIPRVANPMTRQAFRAAVEALRGLPEGIGFSMSFNQSDPRAVSWARLRSGRMIAQITDEQLALIRRAVANAIQNGVTVPQVAAQISRQIGLHDRWQRAVESRFSNDVERLIRGGLSPERAFSQASQAATKYRQKLVRARSRNIARTEVMASQNYGTYLGWVEAGEKGLLNLSVTKKEWAAGPSGWKGISVCDVCSALDRVQVKLTEPFPNGLLTPPAHPSCRCRMILVPPEV